MIGFRLFEIDQLFRDALAVAEEKANPETGELDEGWENFVDEIKMERDKKCLAVAAYIKERSAEAKAIAAEAKALQQRARACQNKADRLKDYLRIAVKEKETLSDTRAVISWRESSAVVVDDEKRLPESCWKVERSIVKTAVKDLLKAKGLEDGIAHIEKRQNILIK